MPRPKKNQTAKKSSNNYKKYNNYKKKSNYKRRNYSSNLIISKPLLPQTQKVGMRYTTRFRIDPHSNVVGINPATSANDLAIHTMLWNNLNDPDYTSQSTLHTKDGAANHQPLMYDQYATFYNYITCLGARAKITFTALDRTMSFPLKDAAGHSTGSTEGIAPPIPVYVGYLTSEFADDASPAVNYDEANERRALRKRRLVDHDKPITMYAKWSLNKENSRKGNLMTEAHQYPETWGAEFGHNVDTFNKRYLHLVAHPISLTPSTTYNDPAEIDVEVEMDFICLLSDRKDIAQSS